MDRSDINHAFTTFGTMFIVFTQTTIPPQPSEGAVHDQKPRQDFEADLTWLTLHEVQANIETLLDLVH